MRGAENSAECPGARGVLPRLDGVALDDHRLVARPRDGQRGREPRHPASGDDELHDSDAIRAWLAGAIRGWE